MPRNLCLSQSLPIQLNLEYVAYTKFCSHDKISKYNCNWNKSSLGQPAPLPTNTILAVPKSTLIQCENPHLISFGSTSPGLWFTGITFGCSCKLFYLILTIFGNLLQSFSSFCCNIGTMYIHRMAWFNFFFLSNR